MSIRVMSRVWDSSHQEGGRLLVLLALADWADDDGKCWPKLSQLATKARMSVRTAQRALLDLEEEGEIERTGTGGRGQACTYRVLSGKGDSLSPITEPERVTSQARKGDKPGGQRVTPVTRKGDNCGALKENHQEPSLTATIKEPSTDNVVVVTPSYPAPRHDDDDALRAACSADEPWDVVEGILDATPCRQPAARARTVLAAIRSAAPTADTDDIQAAADEWAERMERIKGKAPDPITASQLPSVVAAYVKASRTASRVGHGIVPMIER